MSDEDIPKISTLIELKQLAVSGLKELTAETITVEHAIAIVLNSLSRLEENKDG